MSILSFKNISKSYGSGATKIEVLQNIDLQVQEHEFVVILGFSGSGKSTLIALAAGLTHPDKGSVSFRGKESREPGPDRGVIFQNYSLLPWLTARGNIMLAVDHLFPNWSAEKRSEHVDHHLNLVHLSAAADKRPRHLSGGMRQRVSVARTLAMKPDILLMDEPFSALDALTRATLQKEIANIWMLEKKTVVMVTNDIDEAILLADRIIPLTHGPRATFGSEFQVNLPRPRDPKRFNDDEAYKKLRNTITKYFLGLRSEQKLPERMPILPEIKPVEVL